MTRSLVQIGSESADSVLGGASPQPTPVRDGRLLILDLGPREFEERVGEVLRELGERPYRARQLREWIAARDGEAEDARAAMRVEIAALQGEVAALRVAIEEAPPSTRPQDLTGEYAAVFVLLKNLSTEARAEILTEIKEHAASL